MQVDLFFYREPEETKEQEDETAVAEYKDYPTGAIGLDDQWSSQITDAQWAGDAAQPPIAGAPTGGWTDADGKKVEIVIFFCFVAFQWIHG